MGIFNIPPELLLLVAENLSLRDLSSFRSTCYRVGHVLTPRFRKLCLQDVGEHTALQWAAVRGHAELIELAILNGGEIDAPFRGELATAVLGVHGRLCGPYARHPWSLAYNSADTDAKDSIIRTPLFLAACCGSLNAIEVLLKLGASMQCFGEMMTPAHISAERGEIDCVEAFTRAGFDINARGSEDSTILHQAIYGGLEMMKYILQLEGGTNLVNSRTHKGSTPLHYIMSAGDYDQKRLAVELLLQHGADIHARDNDANTPAHIFAKWGDVECLQVLIAAGFDCNTRGNSGRTILHSAIHGGSEMVTYLLGMEAGRMIIDVEDDHRLTPADYASQLHRRGVIKVLLLHGAATRNVEGGRPLFSFSFGCTII